VAARPKPVSLKDPAVSVAYLCGEERFLVQETLTRIRERAFLEVRAPDFNVQRFSSRATKLTEILDSCRTLPVMSPRRLVEVHDAEAITADFQEEFLAYVRAPDPACTLVLVGAKADLRLKLFKELAAAGVLQSFDRLHDRALPGWVVDRAPAHGISISQDAAQGLSLAIGSELLLLDSALEKLRLVVGEGGEVTAKDVATHVASTRVEDNFAIVNSLAAGDLGTALGTMLAVLDADTRPLSLVGALAWAQRQSISLLGMLEGGASVAEAGRELRLFGRAESAARRVQAQGWPPLVAGLVAIGDAERALKSSPLDDKDVLFSLVLSLYQMGKQARQPR
jgi:DNA polymerase-3 subunit delta